MKFSIKVFICFFITVLFACSNNTRPSISASNDIDTDSINKQQKDSILRQQYVDSLLETVKWNNTKSHVGYLGFNGHVSKVEYSIDGDGFYLPFETINFDADGSLISVFQRDYAYNCILEDNPQKKILRLGVDGAGLGMEFNMIRKDNKSIFEGYDEMGSAQFTFHRNADNIISNLSIHYKFYPDMTSDECEEDIVSFKVKLNSCDSLNNWTSITCYSNGERTKINRKFTFIDDPSLIKVIENNSAYRILCKYPTDYDNFYLRMFDSTTNSWQKLVPPPYKEEIFGFSDYRLLNDHLYLIFNTGNNFINAVCGIYLYNLRNNSWEELDMGGEECKFVGNRIKIPHYEIIEYGDCSANDKYKKTISWIDLK